MFPEPLQIVKHTNNQIHGFGHTKPSEGDQSCALFMFWRPSEVWGGCVLPSQPSGVLLRPPKGQKLEVPIFGLLEALEGLLRIEESSHCLPGPQTFWTWLEHSSSHLPRVQVQSNLWGQNPWLLKTVGPKCVDKQAGSVEISSPLMDPLLWNWEINGTVYLNYSPHNCAYTDTDVAF